MSLQFADFDADGHQDIVTATWEGTVFLVRGSAEGWQQPEYIRDQNGDLILLSFYYDVKANDYKDVTLEEGAVLEKDKHLISCFAYDWDKDGDLDLLIGAKTGELYLRRNDGKAGEARFRSKSERLQVGGKPLTVAGGATAMRTVDWDGDGALDLLVGSFEGGAWLYRNESSDGEPVYASATKLLAAPQNANGSKGPESDWYVDAQDVDLDGDLDLIVGGHYQDVPPARTLSADEEKRLKEVSAELQACMQENSKFFDKLNSGNLSKEERQAEFEKLRADPAYTKLNNKMNELRKEQSDLRPMPKRTSGIWVYRNRAVQAEGAAPARNG
ncbi:MAG TPA: VCBS repeat-containing protein [Planctomycetota bacterium]|nr:VCBS repeat-containing protein [Planctomycetota bacterium]